MSPEPLRAVVDASVGIKLFVEETFSDEALDLFARLAENPPAELFVPDLFYIECANIQLKYTRRFGRKIDDALADLADLKLLALKSIPTANLIEEALTLAANRNLTAYDACYAVLAQRLGVPLITADEQMIKAVEWAVRLGEV